MTHGKNCCKKCGSENFVKNGFVRGLQRYHCQHCRCNFTHTKRRGIHPALRAFGIALYGMCGVSMYKIAKLFGVSDVAVLEWIRKEADLIEDVPSHAESKIVMIDEESKKNSKDMIKELNEIKLHLKEVSDEIFDQIKAHAPRRNHLLEEMLGEQP